MTTMAGWAVVGRVIGWRVLEASVVVALAVLVAFTVARLMPGDPIAVITNGQAPNSDEVLRQRAAFGLDASLWRQLGDYGAGLLRGDLGMSWRYEGTPVTELLGDAVPVTLLLVGAAMMMAAPLGITAGIVAAHRPGRAVDRLLTTASVVALATPPMVIATWLMLATVAYGGSEAVSGTFLANLAIPVAALAIMPTAIIARSTRAHILDVVGQDYVRCARAKGLRELAILLRHVLPNALTGIVAVIGTTTGTLFTATAVVETVFNLPGLGHLAILSVLSRDYPLVGAFILVFVLVQLVIGLVTDLVIVLVDPRRREAVGEQ